jgi:polar amino acid transport system substrate-binding protein
MQLGQPMSHCLCQTLKANRMNTNFWDNPMQSNTKFFVHIFVCLMAITSLVFAAGKDDLDTILQRGTIIIGVKDSTPPFGVLNPKTNTIAGYDVDFALAIAKQLGVKVLVKGVESADRIQKLQNGEVDILIATMTKTAEREKLVDFSYGYFITGQKFVTRKGHSKTVDDVAKMRIGTASGSTSEKQLRTEIPKATVVLFNDYDNAFAALGRGDIDAVSTDEPILAGQRSRMAKRDEFEMSPFAISLEVYGIAVRKGQRRLLDKVNETLLILENNGEADKIFIRWFGEKSAVQLNRNFKIMAH